MTDLIVADLHFNDNSRDAYRFELFDTLHRLIRKHKVSRLLVLGDVTEEKDRHGSALVNRIVNEVYELAQECDVDFLQGNHDYAVADSAFFNFLRRVEHVRWIRKPMTENGCLYLPHTLNWLHDWEGLYLKKQDRVFAHNTFEGARSEHGKELRGIPHYIFGKERDYVIAGDVHVPQRIGPVTYVGAPYLVDFGDNFSPRAILHEPGRALVSIPLRGPQKRLVEATSRTLETSFVASDCELGDIVKIRVKIEPDEYANWSTIRRSAAAIAEQLGVKVFSIHPVIDRQQRVAAKRDQRSRRSDEDVFDAYVRTKGIDSKTADIGAKLLKEN